MFLDDQNYISFSCTILTQLRFHIARNRMWEDNYYPEVGIVVRPRIGSSKSFASDGLNRFTWRISAA